MEKTKFARLAESLRQYRRAELKDFEKDFGEKSDLPAIDLIYVDPLPSDAILNDVLSANTTFLLGRKGTGKSTIFTKAQSMIRVQSKDISIYIDVKSIYELINTFEVPVTKAEKIAEDILHTHLIRKIFLGTVISDLLKELRDSCKKLSLFDKWLGKKRDIQDVMNKLEDIERKVKEGKLSSSELPILQFISKKTREQTKKTEHTEDQVGAGVKFTPPSFSITADARISGFDELLSDNEVYASYSDAVLRSFPFAEILEQIKDLLCELGMNKLVIFFDDFSEISYINQRLFVDVVLAPLNNSSDEKVKLKIAGYPGRVYYGKIDPGKVDTIHLDFSILYKDKDIQTTEKRAIDYTTRLIMHRFKAFNLDISQYFDLKTPIEEYMRLLFESTFNVPRLMGYVLNYCYRDRISQDQLITPQSIRLAAQKYYEDVLLHYFDRLNRYALEPFERKLDRHIQLELLKTIIEEVKDIRRQILKKEIGRGYFEGLSNPPASHFSISIELEPVLVSLEFNFLVTKYHEMKDKDGNEVSIYALFYGLCESEKIPWGYPRGRRDDRSYFVQRCFSYNRVLREFLAQRKTIRCEECGASFPMDKRDSFELFNWQCPDCKTGKCCVVNLSDDYKKEIDQLNNDFMLEQIDLDILDVLNNENRPMRAKEISEFIDVSHLSVGKRTSRMKDLGYIDKKTENGVVTNTITDSAREVYFRNGHK
jgi:hypothetical protein